MIALAIAAAIVAHPVSHPQLLPGTNVVHVCGASPRDCETCCVGVSIMRALSTDTTTAVSIHMDSEARITLAYPPCGTPEGRVATACLNWVVRPCPPPPPPGWASGGEPIGCPSGYMPLISSPPNPE